MEAPASLPKLSPAASPFCVRESPVISECSGSIIGATLNLAISSASPPSSASRRPAPVCTKTSAATFSPINPVFLLNKNALPGANCSPGSDALSQRERGLLLSSDYRDPLHLHEQARNRQAGYRDQCTGRKTLFKNFLADSDEPIPVPRIGDKHGHRHHVLQGPALCLQRLLDRRKHIPHLCIKVRHRWQRRGLSSEPKNLSAFRCHRARQRAFLRPGIGRITLLGINGRRPEDNHKPCCSSYEATDLPCRHAILLLNRFMRL